MADSNSNSAFNFKKVQLKKKLKRIILDCQPTLTKSNLSTRVESAYVLIRNALFGRSSDATENTFQVLFKYNL